MPATQLLLDFSAPVPPKAKLVPTDPAWRDVTDIARAVGFHCACEISVDLHEHLSDQALYDVLWTACFSLSLNKTNTALFSLELDGKPVRLKTYQTNHAVRLDRVNDF